MTAMPAMKANSTFVSLDAEKRQFLPGWTRGRPVPLPQSLHGAAFAERAHQVGGRTRDVPPMGFRDSCLSSTSVSLLHRIGRGDEFGQRLSHLVRMEAERPGFALVCQSAGPVND